MYTLCSHCHIAQEVTRDMLVPSRGELVCSHCGLRFDALEGLSRDPPPGYPIARRKTPAEDIQPSLFTPPPGPAPVQLPTGAEVLSDTPAAQPMAATEPPAAPVESRSDPIADVLAAHADFIEPPSTPDDMTTAPSTPEAPSPEPAPPDDTPPPDDDPFATMPDDAVPQGAPAVDDGLHVDAIADAEPLPEAPHRDGPVIDLRDALEMTIGAPAPSFIPNLPTPQAKDRAHRWPGILAVIGLLLLLCVQSLVAERDALAADARWRPWLERACGALGCALSAWREPDAMHILTRDVRPHPSMPEALIISASFRNDARWAQPWPRLDLTLSDINGQPIAQRRFTPEQYLGHLQSAPLILPGQSASIALEVRDPGKQAVAFEFGFL